MKLSEVMALSPKQVRELKKGDEKALRQALTVMGSEARRRLAREQKGGYSSKAQNALRHSRSGGDLVPQLKDLSKLTGGEKLMGYTVRQKLSQEFDRLFGFLSNPTSTAKGYQKDIDDVMGRLGLESATKDLDYSQKYEIIKIWSEVQGEFEALNLDSDQEALNSIAIYVKDGRLSREDIIEQIRKLKDNLYEKKPVEAVTFTNSTFHDLFGDDYVDIEEPISSYFWDGGVGGGKG